MIFLLFDEYNDGGNFPCTSSIKTFTRRERDDDVFKDYAKLNDSTLGDYP